MVIIIYIKFNYVYILSAFMLLCTIFISTSLICNETYSATLPLNGKTIVIDAGHGGLDGGAVAKDGTVEKNINLSIAKYLENALEKSGAKVIMTREKDVSLHSNDNDSVKNKKRSDLINRRNIANNSDADLLISIHLNYFSQPQYKGAQMFYNETFPESKVLAETLQKSVIENVDNSNNRFAKKLDSKKLLFENLNIPGVIAECGFLSNYEESQLLKTKEYQLKIADALYLGIIEYFEYLKNSELKSGNSALVLFVDTISKVLYNEFAK